MGYRADYTLLMDGKELPEPMVKTFNAMFGIDFKEGNIKWYSECEDMKQFSKVFPIPLFTLEALGEDGERWTNYYRDGAVEAAKIVTTISKPTI